MTRATPLPSHVGRTAGAALACLALVACGGGGGSGGDGGGGAEPTAPAEPSVGASGPDGPSGPDAAPPTLPAPRGAPVACGALDDAARAELLELVNAARAEARRCGDASFAAAPPMSWDARLEAAAAGHSDDMATHDFFDHTGSDGGMIGARATAAGFDWSTVGENIAAGQATGADAMTGWIASPGHCENLMEQRYDRLGMACTSDPGATYPTYWTQVFGRSR